MTRPLSALFGLYILTPGRRIYALGRVRKWAVERELDKLVAAIDRAIAHDRKTLRMDAARHVGAVSPSVHRMDLEVDRVLSMIATLLSYAAEREDEAAAALFSTLFPVSVAHHTRLAWIEQAAANERVLDILEGEAHAKYVDARGLRPMAVELRETHDAFEAALNAKDDAAVPTWGEVKAARSRGQELYLLVVARVVVGLDDAPKAYEGLLDPIWDQDATIQLLRRKRQPVVDVDPDSGEPLVSGQPAPAPAPGQAEPAP